MGEARRRRLAGTYPRPDDPLATARRFWCGRGLGPVEDFCMPEGLIGITLDVMGTAPSSVLLDAANLVDVLDEVDRLAPKLGYYAKVHAAAREFVKAKQSRDDAKVPGIGLLSLWTALHHPRAGAIMRAKVSTALRDKGRAHITWQFSTAGLAIALADQFVNLEGFIAHVPGNAVCAYVSPDDPNPPQH